MKIATWILLSVVSITVLEISAQQANNKNKKQPAKQQQNQVNRKTTKAPAKNGAVRNAPNKPTPKKKNLANKKPTVRPKPKANQKPKPKPKPGNGKTTKKPNKPNNPFGQPMNSPAGPPLGYMNSPTPYGLPMNGPPLDHEPYSSSEDPSMGTTVNYLGNSPYEVTEEPYFPSYPIDDQGTNYEGFEPEPEPEELPKTKTKTKTKKGRFKSRTRHEEKDSFEEDYEYHKTITRSY